MICPNDENELGKIFKYDKNMTKSDTFVFVFHWNKTHHNTRETRNKNKNLKGKILSQKALNT